MENLNFIKAVNYFRALMEGNTFYGCSQIIRKFFRQDFMVDLYHKLSTLGQNDSTYEIGDLEENLGINPGTISNVLSALSDKLCVMHRIDPEELQDLDLTKNEIIFLFYMVIIDENLEDSGIIDASICLYHFLMKLKIQFLDEPFTVLAYQACMDNLTKRVKKGLYIPNNLFWELNFFLIDQEINLESLFPTINFLLSYCIRYFNMIQTLSISDIKCSAGFLSFVCLRTIILKDYDKQAGNIKQYVIIYLFNSIEKHVAESDELSEVQTGILHSNFRSLIRQVGPFLAQHEDDVVLALIKMGEHYEENKLSILMINQLPFNIYEQFIVLLTRLMKKIFNPKLQKYCYNLLESPYITEFEEDKEKHKIVVVKLIESILWPLKSGQEDIIKPTTWLLNKTLQLQDVETRKILKGLTAQGLEYSDTKLLNYVYERCNISWSPQFKEINQCFISIFCNMYILRDDGPSLNNYEQFCRMVFTADVIDLIPCLNTFRKVLSIKTTIDVDITYLTLKTIVTNATCPSPEYTHYLEILSIILFDNQETNYNGIQIANIMLNFGYDMPEILRRMAIQKFINVDLINKLCNQLLNGENTWKLLEITTPTFPNATIPASFIRYFENFQKPMLILKGNTRLIFSVVSKFIETKTSRTNPEVHFLHNFMRFLTTTFVERRYSSSVIVYATFLLRRLVDFLETDCEDLFHLFKEMQSNIRQLHNTDWTNSQTLIIHLREVAYYFAFCTAFNTKKNFVKDPVCLSVLKVAIQHIPNVPPLEHYECYSSILKSASGFSVSLKPFYDAAMAKLRVLLKNGSPRMKVLAIRCMKDTSMVRSQTPENLTPILFELIRSPNEDVNVAALWMLVDLINKEFLLPNHWELYSIINIMGERVLEKHSKFYTFEKFIIKQEALFQQYFINILLYFNHCYDIPKYELHKSEVAKLPFNDVPFNKHAIIYDLILKYFSKPTLIKLANEIFTELVVNIDNASFNYPRKYELLQDIIVISLICLKQNNRLYLKNSKQVYEKTLKKIKELAEGKIVENTSDSDIDALIRLVLHNFMHICYDIDNNVRYIVPELYHAILAITEWHFASVCNIVIGEGRDKRFAKMLFKIPSFYKQNDALFHFEERINLDLPSTSHIFYRI